MAIPITCPRCRRVLQIPEQYLGQTGKCNHCGNPIQVLVTPLPSGLGPADEDASLPTDLASLSTALAPPPVNEPTSRQATSPVKNMALKSCVGCLALIGVFVLIIVCFSLFQGEPYPEFESVSTYWSDNRELCVRAIATSSTDEKRIHAHARWLVQQTSPRFVFYFTHKEHTPDITYTGYDFPKEYEPYCIAGFWRYADGREKFQMWPLKGASESASSKSSDAGNSRSNRTRTISHEDLPEPGRLYVFNEDVKLRPVMSNASYLDQFIVTLPKGIPVQVQDYKVTSDEPWLEVLYLDTAGVAQTAYLTPSDLAKTRFKEYQPKPIETTQQEAASPQQYAEESYDAGPSEDLIVYVTETGSKYHRAGCQYLRRSKFAETLSEARSKGYSPCSVCRP